MELLLVMLTFVSILSAMAAPLFIIGMLIGYISLKMEKQYDYWNISIYYWINYWVCMES